MELKNNKNNNNKTKKFFLRKISLSKFENMEKDLYNFFWDVNKYFQKNYEKFDIILGNNNNKNKIIPSFLTNSIKKRIKRGSALDLNNNNSHSHEKKNNESKITMNSNTSRFGGKRLMKNNKENGLKVGQKYITESELEEIFKAFCSIHKMNKKKSNNFIMAKDYIDNNILMSNKTFSNFGKYIENKKNQLNRILPNNISSFNNDYNKSISSLMTIGNLKEKKEDNKNDFISSNVSSKLKANIFKNDVLGKVNEIINDKKYKTMNNYYHNENILDSLRLKTRNKLVKRQIQYIKAKKELEEKVKENNKAINDHYAKLLADQEQVMMNIEKMKSKKNKISKFISQKAKKDERNLLLKDLESYRIQNELKDKFCSLGEKLEPEHNYCWKKDLRGNLYIHKKNENNLNYFNIRDPYNRTITVSFSDKNLAKQQFIKYYKNLVEENYNINKNLEGLYIKGKNLLKMEYEQFKNIKNRKILNNYEQYLPSSEVDDVVFIDKKYSNNKP